MDNSTTADTRPPVDTNKSTIFEGLTKPEETAVIAAIVVAGLAVCAIILRFMMPLMRRICRKCKGSPSALSGNKSTSDLLASGPHSSPASRASTLSRSSQSDVGKYGADDETSVTTVSGRTSDMAKNSVYGNLRSGGLSLPLYLPKMKSDEIPRSASAQRLNQELTSVISTPTLQRLQSLNLNDTYRTNWDRTFDPDNQHASSLSYVTHPSESRRMPDLPEVHRSTLTGQDRQFAASPQLKTRF